MINIYLDVDGVLNAYSKNPPRTNTQWSGTWGHQMITGFPILWSFELIEEINALAKRDGIEVKWLTTWQDSAASELSPVLGLNGEEWSFFETEDEDDLVNWWKLAAIKKDIEESSPDKVVWIDDDIPFEKNAVQWSQSLDIPILTVSPNSNHGLTKKQWNGIIDFVS